MHDGRWCLHGGQGKVVYQEDSHPACRFRVTWLGSVTTQASSHCLAIALGLWATGVYLQVIYALCAYRRHWGADSNGFRHTAVEGCHMVVVNRDRLVPRVGPAGWGGQR